VAAGLKAAVGGEIGVMTDLLRDCRKEALTRMIEEAERNGADAVIAMRFDVTADSGWVEVCAYGTAVQAHERSDG
jgi:uncharacterized protein YbjQ (UPF0145 family)